MNFHAAIEKVVMPFANKLIRERKEQLGLDVLKPWDLSVDPFNREPLTPFENADELESGCHNIFGAVDPDLGKHFSIMREQELLDLVILVKQLMQLFLQTQTIQLTQVLLVHS